jgi:hypothetical protein
MKNDIKIDINGDDWKSVEQANEQIETLRLCIVSFREDGMDIDFSAVEEAKKIRDKLFPANERNNHE